MSTVLRGGVGGGCVESFDSFKGCVGCLDSFNSLDGVFLGCLDSFESFAWGMVFWVFGQF